MSQFLLSIEPTEGESFMYGFHLGTDERDARKAAEDIFKHRRWFERRRNVTIRTVALKRDGKLFDVYDGQWNSETPYDDDLENVPFAS